MSIGLNSVDPNHYHGWSGELLACEADAKAMSRIASSEGFNATTLLTAQATRSNIENSILDAAKTLKSGDIFMLDYSGHGGDLPDLNGDEIDAQDETWCLYDGELVDDELNVLLSKFAAGVRVLVFSDSCHSGTVTKAAYLMPDIDVTNSNVDSTGARYRFMPSTLALHTYEDNKEFYDGILKKKINDADLVKASVLLISGCQDNQLSKDGIFNSLFTAKLLEVWRDGNFDGDYGYFHKMITMRMPPMQTPNYYTTGQPDRVFERQRPFKI